MNLYGKFRTLHDELRESFTLSVSEKIEGEDTDYKRYLVFLLGGESY